MFYVFIRVWEESKSANAGLGTPRLTDSYQSNTIAHDTSIDEQKK